MKNQAIDVLMVEDDEIDIMNVQRLFHKAKITNRLSVAKDGRSALELLKSRLELRNSLLLLVVQGLNTAAIDVRLISSI